MAPKQPKAHTDVGSISPGTAALSKASEEPQQKRPKVTEESRVAKTLMLKTVHSAKDGLDAEKGSKANGKALKIEEGKGKGKGKSKGQSKAKETARKRRQNKHCGQRQDRHAQKRAQYSDSQEEVPAAKSSDAAGARAMASDEVDIDALPADSQEEALSLVQTEAHIEHKNAPTETFEVLTPSELKVKKKMEILADMELEDKDPWTMKQLLISLRELELSVEENPAQQGGSSGSAQEEPPQEPVQAPPAQDYPPSQAELQKLLMKKKDTELEAEKQEREDLERSFRAEKGMRTVYEIENIEMEKHLTAKTRTIALQQQTIVDAVELLRKFFDGKNLPEHVQRAWNEIDMTDCSTARKIGSQEKQCAHFQNLCSELLSTVNHLDGEEFAQVTGVAPRRAAVDEGVLGRAKGFFESLTAPAAVQLALQN